MKLTLQHNSDCSGVPVLIPALASFGVTVLLFVGVVLVLVFWRRKRQQRVAKLTKAEDKNPVYGMYYFADGEHIDESRSEVLDNNENYGS